MADRMSTFEVSKKVDVEKAKQALLRVWEKNTACPFSGHRDWGIAEEFVEIKPPSSPAYFPGGGNTYPAVLVYCNGCGYMALFSAVVLGLIQKDPLAASLDYLKGRQ
jgi:hypothetical protein